MQIIKNKSSSFKEKKESPLRTQKSSTKGETGYSQITANTKKHNAPSTKKSKQYSGTNMKTNQPQKQSIYKDPIFQHSNIMKTQNLSLNNFKTEMRLPQTQNFLAETQFVKSPFLAKTLKGMMQPQDIHSSNFNKVGIVLQSSTGRKQRDPSANSNKSKRETSGSQKKGSKSKLKLFNNKKLSFNQNAGKQIRDISDILSKKAISTTKIYSRNDANVIGTGCFLTTGDGDKRYSNRAKQPKQIYYFNSSNNRMNKTMVNALNKSSVNHSADYIVASSTVPPKRSNSGKVKKPKSGRSLATNTGVSRNNRNVAIYTMAPVMTMNYKKKQKVLNKA